MCMYILYSTFMLFYYVHVDGKHSNDSIATLNYLPLSIRSQIDIKVLSKLVLQCGFLVTNGK